MLRHLTPAPAARHRSLRATGNQTNQKHSGHRPHMAVSANVRLGLEICSHPEPELKRWRVKLFQEVCCDVSVAGSIFESLKAI